MALTQEYWPNPTDSDEVLREKIDLNLKAGWASCVEDFLINTPDSDATEFIANLARAKTILEGREKEANHQSDYLSPNDVSDYLDPNDNLSNDLHDYADSHPDY